jgi:hypothetical protein
MAPPEALERKYQAIVTANDKILAAQKRKISRDYAALLKELNSVVANAYERYAKEGTLSYAEVQRFNRIKQIKGDLDRATDTGTRPLFARIQSGLEAVAANSYDTSISIIAAVANSNTGRELSAPEIQEILDKPWSGVTLEERIGLRRTDIGNRVRQTVTQGFIREDSYEDQARNLKDLIVKDYARTGRTLEDIGHQVQSDAFVKSFKDVAEEEIEITKTWVSAGDDRVRDSHAALDGQTVRADEKFTIPSGPNKGATADGPGLWGIPSEDCGCRCWICAGIRKRGD